MNVEMCSLKQLRQLRLKGRKFGTLYVDPPWPYSNKSTRASAEGEYKTMSLERIEALPISDLAADNSHLHLWTTVAFNRRAFSLMDSWGFEYKSQMIWVKPNLGIGNYWRLSHEILLLGVRGKSPFLDRSQISWVEHGRMKHSAKPDKIRKIIEKASPGPRLEIFARPHNYKVDEFSGWVVWGNEIPISMFDRCVKEVFI